MILAVSDKTRFSRCLQGTRPYQVGWGSELKQRGDAHHNCTAQDDDNQIDFPPFSLCGIIAANPKGIGNMASKPVDDSSPPHICAFIGSALL